MQFAVILAPIMDFLKKNWQYVLVGYLIWVATKKLRGGAGSVTYVASVNEAKSTISDSDAQQFADSLLNAMDQFGKDQPSIDFVWNRINNNPENLKKVYNAFGKVDYGTWGKASGIWLTPSTSLSLYGWLHNEVSDTNWVYWKTLFSSAGIYS